MEILSLLEKKWEYCKHILRIYRFFFIEFKITEHYCLSCVSILDVYFNSPPHLQISKSFKDSPGLSL